MKFEEINGSKEHIDILYSLLNKRVHNISHVSFPSFADHTQFVKNHPYRYWFLVQEEEDYIGTIYIKDDNSLGINLSSKPDLIKDSILYLVKNFKPLPPVKSIRSEKFHINISPENIDFHHILNELGAELIEYTFTLDIS